MKQKQSSPALSRLNHYNGWIRQADCVKNKHWRTHLAASRDPHLGNKMGLVLCTLNTKIILIAMYAVVKMIEWPMRGLWTLDCPGLPWTSAFPAKPDIVRYHLLDQTATVLLKSELDLTSTYQLRVSISVVEPLGTMIWKSKRQGCGLPGGYGVVVFLCCMFLGVGSWILSLRPSAFQTNTIPSPLSKLSKLAIH